MDYSKVTIMVISPLSWPSNKLDPTEYDYHSKTIKIRRDYMKQMVRSKPLTYHWIYHEFAHHILLETYGQNYIDCNNNDYPNNAIERFAFGYQFAFLKSNTIISLKQLCETDPFFSHKKPFIKMLEYYWNNSGMIMSEFNQFR